MDGNEWFEYCSKNIEMWKKQLNPKFISVQRIIDFNTKLVAAQGDLQFIALREVGCESVAELMGKVTF